MVESALPPEYQVEQHRPRLLGLAYRMVGEMDDAEDLVQEAFGRWHESDRSGVASPEGWLVTVVTRLAIDRIRRLATERRGYVGPWLPEPISLEASPDRRAELDSDLSMAMLVLLERLAPEERAALILRDALGTEYAEIARILDRNEAAVRQMVHRARTRVRTPRARFDIDPADAERVLARFLEAMESEDPDAVMAVLAPDVTYLSDSGGFVRSARRKVVGSDRVARLVVGIRQKPAHQGEVHIPSEVNGGAAYLIVRDDVLIGVVALDIGPTGIRGFYKVVNPAKLRRLTERTSLRLE